MNLIFKNASPISLKVETLEQMPRFSTPEAKNRSFLDVSLSQWNEASASRRNKISEMLALKEEIKVKINFFHSNLIEFEKLFSESKSFSCCRKSENAGNS